MLVIIWNKLLQIAAPWIICVLDSSRTAQSFPAVPAILGIRNKTAFFCNSKQQISKKDAPARQGHNMFFKQIIIENPFLCQI